MALTDGALVVRHGLLVGNVDPDAGARRELGHGDARHQLLDGGAAAVLLQPVHLRAQIRCREHIVQVLVLQMETVLLHLCK